MRKERRPIKTDRRRSKTAGTYFGSLKDKIAVVISPKLTVFVNSKSDIARVKQKYADRKAEGDKDLATLSHYKKNVLTPAQKEKWRKKNAEKVRKRREMQF